MLRITRCKTINKDKAYRKVQKKVLRNEVKQLKKTMKHSVSFYYTPISIEVFETEQRKKTQIHILKMILNTLETYNCEASEKLSKNILWTSAQITSSISEAEKNEILKILIKEIQVFIKII